MHISLIRRQRPLLHNDATKNEINKSGQLLVLEQGFKLACCVDRFGVQARATCSHGDRYDADNQEAATHPREAALV